MTNPSSTPPIFAQSCRDILERLEGRQGDEPRRMRLAAQRLLETFNSWLEEVPSPTVRTAAVNELFALYREVLDFCLKK